MIVNNLRIASSDNGKLFSGKTRKDYLVHELEFVEVKDCALSAGEIIAVAA